MGLADKLKVGNIEGRRDWGYAGDYVRAMWLMLQQSAPEDFVIATGVTHSVKELLEIAFAHVGLDWQKYVEIDPALLRPAEDDPLAGDVGKANRILGWKPTITFEQMVRMMVDSDLSLLSKPAALATGTFGAGD
jgi:GDPmannose 4,6-dehydratase